MWTKHRRLVSAVVAVLVFLMISVRMTGSSLSAQVARNPFASAIEQRQAMIQELRKLNRLMEKQLELLASGKVQVIVVERPNQNARQ